MTEREHIIPTQDEGERITLDGLINLQKIRVSKSRYDHSTERTDEFVRDIATLGSSPEELARSISNLIDNYESEKRWERRRNY